MKISFLSGLLGLVALLAFGGCFVVQDPITLGFFKALSLASFVGYVKCLSSQR